MRSPFSATILLALAAAPAPAQPVADPSTIKAGEWVYAGQVGGADSPQRVMVDVHWNGISEEGPHRVTWVQWTHRTVETVPGDSAWYRVRMVRQRFDCAGRRWQPLATRYYRHRADSLVQVGAAQTPGAWTPADTTTMAQEMIDVACLPRDVAVRMGIPALETPKGAWMEVARDSPYLYLREVDTAGRQRHGDLAMIWARDFLPPRPFTNYDGEMGERFDTHYRLLRIDCATRRYRVVRQVLAYSGKFVDSVTGPSATLPGYDSTDDGYVPVSAACGGPPAGAPTSLRAPGALHTGTLAMWHRAGATPRRRQRRVRNRRRE